MEGRAKAFSCSKPGRYGEQDQRAIMMMMFENVVAGVVCVRWVCARWAEQRESVEVEGPTGHQSERDGRTVHIVVVVVRDNCQQQLCTLLAGE